MQNKPNFQKAATNLTSVAIKGYINIPLHDSFKNKANSKPIEPNRQNPKMNLTFSITRDYEKKSRFYTAKNKAELRNEYNLLLNKGLREFMYITASKTNPIQSQFQTQFQTQPLCSLILTIFLLKSSDKFSRSIRFVRNRFNF